VRVRADDCGGFEQIDGHRYYQGWEIRWNRFSVLTPGAMARQKSGGHMSSEVVCETVLQLHTLITTCRPYGPVTEPLWLGETAGFWLQTGAFIISAIGALGALAYSALQFRHLRIQSRQAQLAERARLTLDAIARDRNDL